jgi:hypothetical protein
VILALLIAALEIEANPANYLGAVALLGPGDILRLAPGTYRDCLELDGLHGTREQPIVITGPDDRGAVFLAERCDGWTNRSRVVVKLSDSSWLILRNLEIDGEGRAVDGVEAGYGDTPVHHITLESLYLHDLGATNQENGISCFATAWDWTIRNNVIERAGTGIYLGNSNGRDPFIRGTIEGNVVRNTRGYSMQIKHQRERPEHEGTPPDGSVTVIRGNTFIKAAGSSLGEEARPNLLLGHVPLEGTGANDRYLVEGNTFLENQSDDEPLFQAEGNVDFTGNVLFNSYRGACVWIRPHNDVPREIRVERNLFLCSGPAVVMQGGSLMHAQVARANVIFSDDGEPVVGAGEDNFTANLAEAPFLLSDRLEPLPLWEVRLTSEIGP